MQQILSLLRQSFLGQGVDEKALTQLLQAEGVQVVLYEKGACIYDKTHTKQSLGLVLGGKVEITKPQAQGEAVLMNLLGPGQCFGAASMFGAPQAYVTEIRAAKRCEVLFLPQDALTALFMQSPRAMQNYIEFLTGRIYYLNQKIDAYTGGSAVCRLAMYLLDHQDRGEPPTVELPFGMNKLASLLGIGRASLYRAMETLEQKGLVAREGKCIQLLQPKALLHPEDAQAIREELQR
ncbi:MAG: Crp/Fnr family transcriptional regulator [Christensenellales bacterium]